MSGVVADSDNLILRAAKSLQQTTGFNGGAEIWLDKRLPYGRRFRRRSSMLRLVALEHIMEHTHYRPKELAKIVEVGADIPVFIHGFAALPKVW